MCNFANGSYWHKSKACSGSGPNRDVNWFTLVFSEACSYAGCTKKEKKKRKRKKEDKKKVENKSIYKKKKKKKVSNK